MQHLVRLSLISTLLAALPAYAQLGTPKHSTVEVNAEREAQNLQFVFTVKPKPDMLATFEAPWKFEVKAADGLTFAKTAFDKADMDEKLPGYRIATSTPPSKPAGTLDWTLTAFICKKDKSACYREVHKGTYNWQVATK